MTCYQAMVSDLCENLYTQNINALLKNMEP